MVAQDSCSSVLAVCLHLSILAEMLLQCYLVDSLLWPGCVDLSPGEVGGLPHVHIVGRDLGASGALGTLPGQGHGGAITAEDGDAMRGRGGSWDWKERSTSPLLFWEGNLKPGHALLHCLKRTGCVHNNGIYCKTDKSTNLCLESTMSSQLTTHWIGEVESEDSLIILPNISVKLP